MVKVLDAKQQLLEYSINNPLESQPESGKGERKRKIRAKQWTNKELITKTIEKAKPTTQPDYLRGAEAQEMDHSFAPRISLLSHLSLTRASEEKKPEGKEMVRQQHDNCPIQLPRNQMDPAEPVPHPSVHSSMLE